MREGCYRHYENYFRGTKHFYHHFRRISQKWLLKSEFKIAFVDTYVIISNQKGTDIEINACYLLITRAFFGASVFSFIQIYTHIQRQLLTVLTNCILPILSIFWKLLQRCLMVLFSAMSNRCFRVAQLLDRFGN